MDAILKPWYAVATPHKDICEGRLEEAVFAANLWAVVQNSAPFVYLDAEEFFRKTYMTEGLASVLKRVAAALKGDVDAGDRIISLQTSFGGGKTHTLVALYHFARNAGNIPSLPESLKFSIPRCNVAVFTNATCDVTQGRKISDDIYTHTLWGEVAYQLGGMKLYEKVRANDETKRVPQGIFAEVLKEASPCLILLDELADYCIGAAAVSVGETTLADQTISFVQQLEEATSQVPGVAVVATLPASHLEVAQSEKGQELFSALERRFQRLGADVKPVADDEIYEVVRKRLFGTITPPDEPDYPYKVARAYQEMYSSHAREVPSIASKNTYQEQIVRAYPFHPILIDALYTRWGSHPDFQRTRGVLRLLASIVGDLWQRRSGNTQTQHLIQPCHVHWSIDAMQAALIRLWGMAYQTVIAADISGEKSNAYQLDDERGGDYERESISRGIASAILLGSFGGQAGRSGFSARDLKLACSRVGLNWNYTDGALLELENRCFYLHTTAAGSLGKRYWFGTKPTLNKLIVQYRQQYAGQKFDTEILETLREQTQKIKTAQMSWRIVLSPGENLPEQKSLTLLILPPSLSWDENNGGKDAICEYILKISNYCGGKNRLYRNTLIFLAPTFRGISNLRKLYRDLAALEGVRRDYWTQLDSEQKTDLKKRIETTRQTVIESLGAAYTVALKVQGTDIETCILTDARPNFQEHLNYLWNTLVEEEEWILRKVGTVTLKKNGLIPEEGAIRLKDAIEAFLKFTDKPMIATKQAVTQGLAQACKEGLVGIGMGTTPKTLQIRYCKQNVALDPAEDGVWIIPSFESKQPESSPALSQYDKSEKTTASLPVADTVSVTGQSQKTTVTVKPGVKRFAVHGPIPVENYGELFRCFISPSVQNRLKLRINIQFDMEIPDDQEISSDDSILKAMQEAARQLGLKFEIKK